MSISKELTARLDELRQELDASCDLVSAGEMTRQEERTAYHRIEKALRGFPMGLANTYARRRDSLLSYCFMRQGVCARCLASLELALAKTGALSECRALLGRVAILFELGHIYAASNTPTGLCSRRHPG